VTALALAAQFGLQQGMMESPRRLLAGRGDEVIAVARRAILLDQRLVEGHAALLADERHALGGAKADV
jgi:hypothetical protein